MTAHSLTGDRERCLTAGMDDYVSKPVKAEELLAALRRWEPTAAPALSLVEGGPTDDALPVLDRERLLESCGGDEEIIEEVLADYLAVTPGSIARLAEATAAGDLARIRYESHTLKGSSRTIGAEALAAVCETIEHSTREGELEKARTAHPGIAAEWSRLQPLLLARTGTRAA